MTGNTGGAGSSFTQRLQSIINRASASGEIQVLGQTKIISDERTNSLLVFASKEDMKIIKEIVSKLDVVLAQVLIEAAIIEVDLTASQFPGIQLSATSAERGPMDGRGGHQQRQHAATRQFRAVRGDQRHRQSSRRASVT